MVLIRVKTKILLVQLQSSVGQKLPNWWEMHIRDLQRQIAAKQFPHKINIGVEDYEELIMVPCVEDATHIKF